VWINRKEFNKDSLLRALEGVPKLKWKKIEARVRLLDFISMFFFFFLGLLVDSFWS